MYGVGEKVYYCRQDPYVVIPCTVISDAEYHKRANNSMMNGGNTVWSNKYIFLECLDRNETIAIRTDSEDIENILNTQTEAYKRLYNLIDKCIERLNQDVMSCRVMIDRHTKLKDSIRGKFIRG